MRKLSEVEDARVLMTEAMNWSVMKWLSEKKRVRKQADLANAALDQLDQEIKTHWSDEVKAAYTELGGKISGADRRPHKHTSHGIDPQVALLARKLKTADDEAYRARMDAEDTFYQAEKHLSTRLAREGCQKAIDSWDLHEQAIRKAEAVFGGTKD